MLKKRFLKSWIIVVFSISLLFFLFLINNDNIEMVSAQSELHDIGFTGQRTDDATGLISYPYRTYDANAGRFLQRDPSGYVDGDNLYEYVSGNTLGATDELGLQRGKVFIDLFKTGEAAAATSKVDNLFAQSVGLRPKGGVFLDEVGGIITSGSLRNMPGYAELYRAHTGQAFSTSRYRSVTTKSELLTMIPTSGELGPIKLPPKVGRVLTDRQERNLRIAEAAIAESKLKIVRDAERPVNAIKGVSPEKLEALAGAFLPVELLTEKGIKIVSAERFKISGKFVDSIWVDTRFDFRTQDIIFHHELQHVIDRRGKGIGRTIMEAKRKGNRDAEIVAEVRARIAQGLPIEEAIIRSEKARGVDITSAFKVKTPRQILREIHGPFRKTPRYPSPRGGFNPPLQ